MHFPPLPFPLSLARSHALPFSLLAPRSLLACGCTLCARFSCVSSSSFTFTPAKEAHDTMLDQRGARDDVRRWGAGVQHLGRRGWAEPLDRRAPRSGIRKHF
eukprot:1030698-Rhodomonas_salina.1